LSQEGVDGSHYFGVLVCVSAFGGADTQLGVAVEHVLDCVRGQDVFDVGVRHADLGQTPVAAQLLAVGVLGRAAEDGLELLEGALGPDHEAAEVASRGQLQDAE